MPALGASPHTGFIYIEISFSKVKQQKAAFGIFASPEPYSSVEAFIRGRCILWVSRKDLVDKTRVYRFPNNSRNHFTKSKNVQEQRFLQVGTEKFILLDSDPSIGKGILRDWRPVG